VADRSPAGLRGRASPVPEDRALSADDHSIDEAVPRPAPVSLSPAWGVPLRAGLALILPLYMHLAYRIRGWGRLPFRRGPTLVVSNHVHDLDTVTMVMRLSLAGPWRDPIFVAVSRRLFEPGYMAVRAPRLRPWLSRSDWSPFFRALGFLPIENELRSRPLVSLAWAVRREHGNLPLPDVFTDDARRVLGPAAEYLRLEDVTDARYFDAAQTHLTLEALREPYRSEIRLATRRQVEDDLARMQSVLRGGGTLYIMPEGGPSPDGGLRRLRGALWALAPLGRVYLAPISYDPFLGRRLSILYRVIPLGGSGDVATALASTRPVTVSQVLAEWLDQRATGEAFSETEAIRAVRSRLDALPPLAFIDPPLRRRPEQVVRAALRTLVRLRLLRCRQGRYGLTGHRTHRKFPWVPDIITHQVRCFAETRNALARREDGDGT
jgi:hypothetical protein